LDAHAHIVDVVELIRENKPATAVELLGGSHNATGGITTVCATCTRPREVGPTCAGIRPSPGGVEGVFAAGFVGGICGKGKRNVGPGSSNYTINLLKTCPEYYAACVR
jgi:hypothetical protein